MRRHLIAAASVVTVLAAHQAVAADLGVRAMPVKAPVMEPVYNWTGFYIGGVAGYGWGRDDWTRIVGSGGGSANGTVRSFDPNGGVVGGQIGYNFQMNQLVFGVEGGMVWSGLNGGFSGLNDNGLASWNTNERWIGNIAGRIGFAANNVLFYGKGGVAWTNDDYNHPATSGPGAGSIPLNYTGSDTRVGWLVGAGIEYGFSPNWTAKLEYNYMDFGSKNITLTDPTGRWVTFGINQTVSVIEVGVNYRFNYGGPVVARY
jgi:outer membrane immunogenic protein